MESYLMMLYVTLEQESALKNFFVDHGWGFCKPDLSVTTDKLGPVVPNPPIPSEETSPPEADIPSRMTQTVPKIKNIPPSKPATETTSTVRRGKRRTKSPKHISTPSKQAKVVASIPVPEPSESNETLATEAVESMENETLDTNEIRAPITVQVADGNQFTIKIEQEFQEADNEKREVDNSDVVDNDDCDDGDDDNDEETNVDYTLEGASTSDADTSVKTENLSLGDNSMNVDTAAKDGPSGKHGKRRIRMVFKTCDLNGEVKSVQNCELSIRQASQMYRVPMCALEGSAKKQKDSPVDHQSGPVHILNVQEDCKLSAHLIELSNVGYGYTQAEISRQASDYAIILGKKPFENSYSKEWYRRYSTRLLKRCHLKPVSQPNQKIVCTNRECVAKYYEKLFSILCGYTQDFKPESIFVMDEVDNELDTKGAAQCSILTTIGAGSAAGQIIPPYFVMVTVSRHENNKFARPSPLTTNTFKNYFTNHFMKNVNMKHNENEPLIVLYDGHRSHLSVDLIDWAESHHIVLFVIPPHECCIVEKRNGGVFDPMKSKCNTESSKLTKANKQFKTDSIVSLAKSVYNDVVSPVALHTWFKVAGIHPLQDATSMCDLLARQNKLS